MSDIAASVIGAAGPGAAPLVLARAPGRVNVIGEHTDYNGLPVLPMAIDRAVWVAARARVDGRVHATNLDPRFAPGDFAWGATLAPSPAGEWSNYLKAAIQSVTVRLGRARGGGLTLTVGSDLPAAAGLSSSSALVVATTLAALAAHDLDVDRGILAEDLAAAERYVGVLSGGMDQAVILLAESGAALHVEFFPLRARPVLMPEGCAVIVADSLVRAEKSAGARAAYNRRVVECRLACRILSAALGVALERLGDLVPIASGRPLAPFVERVAALLPDRPLPLAALASASGLDAAVLETLLSDDVGKRLDIGAATTFRPLARLRHVLGEADRVAAAVGALQRSDPGALGRLMHESHRSCRDDYEVSVPALDELVACAEDAGAFGARMTGAGFGGAVVAIAAPADVPRILAGLDARFYRSRLAGGDPRAHRFVFAPSSGADVRLVDAP